MSDVAERVRKIMAVAQNVHVLATVDGEGKPHCRWMGALVEDPNHPWTFYLACGKQSRKMIQIAANSNAQLLFTDQSNWQVATLSGTAVAEEGMEPRKWLFEAVPVMKDYYSGPDDASMAVIRFKASSLEVIAMKEGMQPASLELD